MTGAPSPRILVLDDDTTMLQLLSRKLADRGFTQVTVCTDGHDALQQLDHPDGPPDLIVSDLNMPKMDGAEFVRKLGERGYSGSLILMSGENDERVLRSATILVQAHRMTLLGHLTKPFPRDTLAELLRKWSPPQQGQPLAADRTYSAGELGAAMTRGELVNHYQPQVAVASGRVVAVETLVRWRHPADGMVLPDQFIGVAEESGLIDELTRIVLAAALTHARVWQQEESGLRIAVNLSMENLISLDFPDFVAGQAVAAGVAPASVVLEVTESRLMRDLRVPLEILTRLRMKGFHLSIDDFGTGHSSLAQLRDLPFDELKVDQGFVHRACADSTVRAIFEASLGLATQLGMAAVAEGVEDRDDWNFLRTTGCDFAQGFFIGRPMPAADLPAWMEDWRARARHEVAAERPPEQSSR